LGFVCFWAYVASCWRRANSTIAWSLRLRRKATMLRRSAVVRLSRARMARGSARCPGAEGV
jgi:hypothetical protein